MKSNAGLVSPSSIVKEIAATFVNNGTRSNYYSRNPNKRIQHETDNRSARPCGAAHNPDGSCSRSASCSRTKHGRPRHRVRKRIKPCRRCGTDDASRSTTAGSNRDSSTSPDPSAWTIIANAGKQRLSR